MIIQIRIVIDIPKTDEEKYSQAIEKITEVVKKEFPDLQTTRMYSPIVVTIKEMTAEVKE
jgi:hypothetical protein